MTPHDECPALDLSHASFEEWLQTKSPKFRRNVRKTERDLVARGAVEVRCLRPPLHAAQLDELAAVERASWKGSHGQLFFGDARKAILLREFLADPDSTARVYVLHVDAEAAAFAIVHCDERAWYYYWGAYRQHHPNAGGTLLGRIVQDAFAQRVPAFDFLLGSEGFKRFWASRSREVHHVTWSHGARGRLLAGAITMRRALGRSALVERLRELRRGGSIGRRPEPQAGAGASARED